MRRRNEHTRKIVCIMPYGLENPRVSIFLCGHLVAALKSLK